MVTAEAEKVDITDSEKKIIDQIEVINSSIVTECIFFCIRKINLDDDSLFLVLF